MQAAAYSGKPVYFQVFSPAEFQGLHLGTQQAASARELGENMILSLVLVVWIRAGVLAWRNFRLGRGDRKGALRVAFFIFCAGLLAWLFLANHVRGGLEVPVLMIGWTQALWKAAFFWLCYLALEPHVRRLWPQLLISWSRLMNGQWGDPLVGQNVLLGVLTGVLASAAFQLQVLAPAWFGLTPQPFMPSNPLTLDGPLAVGGYLLLLVIRRLGDALYFLMTLSLLRQLLRREFLASCAFVAVWVLIDVPYEGGHPVLGWFFCGIFFSLLVWVYLRLGLLAGVVMILTELALDGAPLTANFSAWYGGNALTVVAFLFALAAFGFYTSQAGRPIFENKSGERTN
jgi:hypothetical protein